MEQMLMGFSEQDITPESSVQMVGFARADERSRGILHRLYAQVSVWRTEHEQCCLAVIDHLGFSRQHADYLRDAVGKLMSVPREKVMLCFTHTHAAPNESEEPEYFAVLCSRVLLGVSDALQNMVPVSAAWGNAYADIGLNRRNGKTLDRRIGIMKVFGADSSVRLILLHLTAHNNVLKADNYFISPDYFGAVRDKMTAVYGCPVMVTQGASGNVAPKYFKSDIFLPDAADDRFIRSDTALADMADAVYEAAAPVLSSLHPEKSNRLAMYSRTLTLFADVPSYDRALEIAEEAKTQCGIDGADWLSEVRRLLKNGVTCQKEEVEVHFLYIADGCICGVANEIMCEFALRVSDRLRNDLFYFGGYTNGCTGYFPSEEEFDRGGYEVYWSMLSYYRYHGRVFPLRRNSASELIGFVVENSSVHTV